MFITIVFQSGFRLSSSYRVKRDGKKKIIQENQLARHLVHCRSIELSCGIVSWEYIPHSHKYLLIPLWFLEYWEPHHPKELHEPLIISIFTYRKSTYRWQLLVEHNWYLQNLLQLQSCHNYDDHFDPCTLLVINSGSSEGTIHHHLPRQSTWFQTQRAKHLRKWFYSVLKKAIAITCLSIGENNGCIYRRIMWSVFPYCWYPCKQWYYHNHLDLWRSSPASDIVCQYCKGTQ